MFQYGTAGTGPRPESYREDVESAEKFETDKEKEEFYFHLKAGSESGWDYSSRWMLDSQVNFCDDHARKLASSSVCTRTFDRKRALRKHSTPITDNQ